MFGVILLLNALAISFACFFAMNIGASGTASSMGAAYGGGAIRSRLKAVVLVGIVAVLGATLGGEEVTKTISERIIPQHIVTEVIAVIIIASATSVLYLSNRMGIPLSTSEVTVGSLVGVGLVFQQLYIWNVLSIVFIWFALPIVAFWLAKCLDLLYRRFEMRVWKERKNGPLYHRMLILFLILFGCYEAFAAGMNNVANAIGPLISSGMLPLNQGVWLGAIFMGFGAVCLGGPVLETNGKRITQLSLCQGSIVSFSSGTLVIVASIFGIPVPLTQATTMSIIGVGSNVKQVPVWRNPVVKRILFVWFASPVLSMMVSYSLVQLIVFRSPLPFVFTLCTFFLLYIYRNVKVGDIMSVLRNK